MPKKKQGKRKAAQKPKAVRVVYVQRKEREPFGEVGGMVRTGMGAIIGIGITGAIAKSLK